MGVLSSHRVGGQHYNLPPPLGQVTWNGETTGQSSSSQLAVPHVLGLLPGLEATGADQRAWLPVTCWVLPQLTQVPVLSLQWYLVYVDIEEVLRVVDSLEKALQLADGTAVNHQHVGDSDRGAIRGLLGPDLVPLDAGAHLP